MFRERKYNNRRSGDQELLIWFCKLFRRVALDRLGLLLLLLIVYDVARAGHCGHLVGRLLGSVG